MQHQINKIEYEIDNDFKVIIHCENLEEEAAVMNAISKIIFSDEADKEQEHEL